MTGMQADGGVAQIVIVARKMQTHRNTNRGIALYRVSGFAFAGGSPFVQVGRILRFLG